VNEKTCSVIARAKRGKEPVKSSTWAEVRAGQLVLLSKDEQVPADVLIISSSNPLGVVYVDTMALDGETNLK
jgi:phospholipid-translocating ATPase